MTVQEIRDVLAEDFMRNSQVAAIYNFPVGARFDEYFSRVSIENILFYVFAAGSWLLQELFGQHKEEVAAIVDEMVPHRRQWYRNKTLAFMKGIPLVADTDRYDTSEMTEAEIEAARVVKHAVAVETTDSTILTIKVAGDVNGRRGKLNEETEAQLRAYLAEVKDAGVPISLINTDPDTFNCRADIYYDAMIGAGVKDTCEEAIKNYVENLPFNGEYSNMALVDALQGVAGVKIVGFREATTSPAASSTVTVINARHTPLAGYFALGEIDLQMTAYE